MNWYILWQWGHDICPVLLYMFAPALRKLVFQGPAQWESCDICHVSYRWWMSLLPEHAPLISASTTTTISSTRSTCSVETSAEVCTLKSGSHVSVYILLVRCVEIIYFFTVGHLFVNWILRWLRTEFIVWCLVDTCEVPVYHVVGREMWSVEKV